MDIEMLRMMQKAGCYHIKYGVEFGTQKCLTKTKKNTTLEQARRTISDTERVGIAAKASFMIGMPRESAKEIRATIDFAKELDPTYATLVFLSFCLEVNYSMRLKIIKHCLPMITVLILIEQIIS